MNRRTFVSAALCPLGHLAPPNDPLIASLDLARPELATVKAAADAGDIPGARREFAEHLRKRTAPKWFMDPANPPRDMNAGQRASADHALAHTFESVGIRHTFAGPIDWAFNPTTQPGSPDAVDHEWTWQLNRHSAWADLSRAYTATRDAKYGRELAQQIADWIRLNPAPTTRAAYGAFSRWRTIESGIRMFSSWPEVYCRMLLHPDAFPDEVLLAMVDSMRQHAEYLDRFPTGGNWLCMEANGEYHVGVLFPEMRDSAKWRENSLTRLRRELDAQVYPDGAQMELTPGYHNVALRNFVQALRLARLNAMPTPPGYQDRLERMYEMNLRAMSPDRDVPPLNDSWSVNVRQVLADGLTLFPARKEWEWVVTNGKKGAQPRETSHLFPYAGWAVMRSGWDEQARFLMMDCGPFGLGHQHEDKLSFVLHAFGARLVFDAGSYAYDASQMRRYVLMANGHNVIHVDGLAQNRRGGPRSAYVVKAPVPLVWRSDRAFDFAAARFGVGPDEVWGVQRKRGFTHSRRVLFVKPDYWIVCDTVEAPDAAEHLVESTFHLDAPTAEIDEATKRVTMTHASGVKLAVIPLAQPGLGVRIVQGQMEPEVQGWLPHQHGRTGADPRPCVYDSVKAVGVVRMLYVFAPAARGAELPVDRVDAVDGMDRVDAVLAARVVRRTGAADVFALRADGSVAFRRGSGREVTFPGLAA